MNPQHGSRGFTLLELIIAMAVMALLAVAISGVIVLGANSAGSGERISEQARRLRMATDVVARQIRSTEAIRLPVDDENQAFYLGEETQLEFVTSTPQRADVSGLAIVRYWLDGDVFMMSEVPLFAARDDIEFGFDLENVVIETPLLYNVASMRFGFRRSVDDEWQDVWDAYDEDQLPAAVRVELEPTTPDGPTWIHEVPVMIGVFNEITGEDDFRRIRRASRGRDREQEEDDDEEDEVDDFEDEDDDDEDDDD